MRCTRSESASRPRALPGHALAAHEILFETSRRAGTLPSALQKLLGMTSRGLRYEENTLGDSKGVHSLLACLKRRTCTRWGPTLTLRSATTYGARGPESWASTPTAPVWE